MKTQVSEIVWHVTLTPCRYVPPKTAVWILAKWSVSVHILHLSKGREQWLSTTCALSWSSPQQYCEESPVPFLSGKSFWWGWASLILNAPHPQRTSSPRPLGALLKCCSPGWGAACEVEGWGDNMGFWAQNPTDCTEWDHSKIFWCLEQVISWVAVSFNASKLCLLYAVGFRLPPLCLCGWREGVCAKNLLTAKIQTSAYCRQI